MGAVGIALQFLKTENKNKCLCLFERSQGEWGIPWLRLNYPGLESMAGRASGLVAIMCVFFPQSTRRYNHVPGLI